ncbi:hypothetical protein FH972_024901 [Carpinus fangiana]|uniref:RAVE complex protein Rav1 C-terminal domain-containing protein n=1 Tax=Carpinus fangiana TaxID=176857 RepID=A0A5N6KZT2_9ROSI|nr:hypothetical protein FH972_024901 [Carpinus fangiana]
MQAVLPGKPQPTLQAFDTVYWEDQRVIAYISRNALIILRGPRDLAQTITLDDRHDLSAVAIDKATGKIAVSTASTVHIYRPYGHEYGAAVQWSLLFEYTPSNGDNLITCLSWGLPDEILIGGASLTLLSAADEPRESWTRKLANPAIHASFSHDAGLIASTGHCDRLAKIWRRLYFGSDNERFDAAYLAHPAAVTGLWWRGRPDEERHTAAVLYTTSADNKLRVWTDVNSHCVQILELWHELDLLACIQPRQPAQEQRRFIFTIDSWDFKNMIENAGSSNDGERERHHRDHLREMTAKEPEICVVLDDAGNMSAWGLERVGHKARHHNDVLNMAYAEDAFLAFPTDVATSEDYMRLTAFPSASQDGSLATLAHHFSGKIDWLTCRVDSLFDPTKQQQRIRLQAPWTGHSWSVKQLIPAFHGSTRFLSLSDENEAVVWQSSVKEGEDSLVQHSILSLHETAIDGTFFADDRFLALLFSKSVEVWDVGLRHAKIICEAELANHLSLLSLVSKQASKADILVAASTGLQCKVWNFVSTPTGYRLHTLSSSVEHRFKTRKLVKSYVEPGSLMSDCASDGSLQHWIFVSRPDEAGVITSVDLTPSKHVVLKGNNEFRFVSPGVPDYMAVTHEVGNAISIYNLDSQCLEYEASYPEHHPIKWITWGVATDDVSILGVVLPHKIHILCQARVNHRHNKPPWINVQTIDLMNETPHEADAAMWHPASRNRCHMVVDTVARQMFEYTSAIGLSNTTAGGKIKTIEHDLVHVAAQLNGALAVYHPTMIVELISMGRLDIVFRTLKTLEKRLKFFAEGDQLDSSLDLDILTSPNSKIEHNNVERSEEVSGDDSDEFNPAAGESLLASMKSSALSHISRSEQEGLTHLVKSLCVVRTYQQSVDHLGLRFLSEFQYQQLREGTPMKWREVVWALYSTSQEILLDLTTRHLDSKLLWEDAKSIGMFMWMTDVEAMKSRFENVARTEYSKTEERNPVDCSLFYIALRKKTALAGLWRMATWNKERTATMKLLANNFDDPRWKSAALKNAYALLGRHRTQYAAAFFLLAGSLKDCVNVLANQLGDLQLAIAVARVYEGTETAGPVLKELIHARVLPHAARTGDVWLALWAYKMLEQPIMALRALTEPLANLVVVDEDDASPRTYRADDPALVHMVEGATAPAGTVEKLEARVGAMKLDEGASGVPSMLDGFESPAEEKAVEVKPGMTVNGAPRKVVKEEPSAASIFDNFDF